ncbi:HEXXH motif-containing putative peptide modification protein [Streptomyces sp. NPDC048430]|uniref:aKG-HExxH-type peptide beta-hydroxylase n=1 Tax=Streptomyces sp. NPDC048430 TaxID=3155388 RepID=UPI0034302935
MTDIAAVLDLDTITTHRRHRTAAALDLLHPGDVPPPGAEDVPTAYALAHHRLEGAENAARHRDITTLDWYRTTAGPVLARLVRSSRRGQRVVIAPGEDELIRGPHSDTPYYVLGPGTTSATESLTELADEALDHIAPTGLDELVRAHAAVICLTSWRRPDQTLRSFAITRLPATVFTDFTDDAAVLGRDLVHEAAHNWLNDALSAAGCQISEEAAFYSPWRATKRPAFGFLHACWAFPLTMIYTARVLPQTSGPVHRFLAAYLDQQRELLAATADVHPQALTLVGDADLRQRLGHVHTEALTL